MSHQRHIIMSVLVEHALYVHLSYVKRRLYCLNRQGKIANFISPIGRPLLLKTSRAHFSIQTAFEWNIRARDETGKRFYLYLSRQSLLVSICWKHPLSKISLRRQVSWYTRSCAVSGTNGGPHCVQQAVMNARANKLHPSSGQINRHANSLRPGFVAFMASILFISFFSNSFGLSPARYGTEFDGLLCGLSSLFHSFTSTI